MAELKAIYQKGASPTNMDPVFQTTQVWVWSGELNHPWSAWGYAFYNGLEGWHSMKLRLRQTGVGGAFPEMRRVS